MFVGWILAETSSETLIQVNGMMSSGVETIS